MGHRTESSTTLATGDTQGDLIWGSRPDPDVVRGCSYCGRADCESLFDHEREARGNEVTYWSAAVRPRNFSARRAAA